MKLQKKIELVEHEMPPMYLNIQFHSHIIFAFLFPNKTKFSISILFITLQPCSLDSHEYYFNKINFYKKKN